MHTGQLPLLSGLLMAQNRDNEVVGTAHIEDHAKLVIEFAQQFHDPILIPIGAAAQRLLGAVTLLACNTLDIPITAHRLVGREVLLVGPVTASLIEFEAAATNARRRGAA